jgi:hypothetical protein
VFVQTFVVLRKSVVVFTKSLVVYQKWVIEFSKSLELVFSELFASLGLDWRGFVVHVVVVGRLRARHARNQSPDDGFGVMRQAK